jgi:hypothetical protein
MSELGELRACKYSKQEFYPNRTNQVFIDEKSRKKYYNEKYGKLRRKLNTINKALFINYRASIEALDGKSSVIVNSHYLKGLGFNFKYITHFEIIDGKTCYGLYDVSFIKINETEYKLIRAYI